MFRGFGVKLLINVSKNLSAVEKRGSIWTRQSFPRMSAPRRSKRPQRFRHVFLASRAVRDFVAVRSSHLRLSTLGKWDPCRPRTWRIVISGDLGGVFSYYIIIIPSTNVDLILILCAWLEQLGYEKNRWIKQLRSCRPVGSF